MLSREAWPVASWSQDPGGSTFFDLNQCRKFFRDILGSGLLLCALTDLLWASNLNDISVDWKRINPVMTKWWLEHWALGCFHTLETLDHHGLTWEKTDIAAVITSDGPFDLTCHKQRRFKEPFVMITPVTTGPFPSCLQCPSPKLEANHSFNHSWKTDLLSWMVEIRLPRWLAHWLRWDWWQWVVYQLHSPASDQRLNKKFDR